MSQNVVNSYRYVEPCVPEMWSQTTGTTEINFNGSSVMGAAINIDTGSSAIGKTLTSFKMNMKRLNTSSNVLVFGVYSGGGTTPATTFTGSITNSNQLTTSFAWYTFTGSHTLALNDHIGFVMGAGAGATMAVKRIANVGESTVTDLSMVIYGSHVSDWWNYSVSQIPYHEGFQTC